MTKYSGAALSADAIKLSAKQAAAMPLPADRAAWDHAAQLFASAQDASDDRERYERLCAFGGAACDSYSIPEPARTSLLEWWRARLGLAVVDEEAVDA